MDIYKKINVFLLAIAIFIALYVWLYWKMVCANTGCDDILREYVMRPLLWGARAWSIILATLLFFPSSVVRKWLPVGTVGLIAMMFTILSTDPHSSNILSIDRGQAAWFTGVMISFFTGMFILGLYGYLAWKKRPLPSSWTRLLILIPAGLIVYLVAIS